MMAGFIAFMIWWILGTTSIIWLQTRFDAEGYTWKQLFGACLLGLSGPFMWVIILMKIIVSLDFWDRPIFGRKGKK